ncbi:DUF1501 domain-containing protein [Rhodopirellula sp.]|nr:DUF1501 domain-containing protein [Rhodopirellula sp.]
MNPLFEHQQEINRRSLLGRAATGVGAAALATLLKEDGIAEQITAGGPSDSNSKKTVEQRFGGISSLPHFAPKAKRVIYLFQNGAPTHVDLFDWKPELQRRHQEPVPSSYIQNRRFSTMTGAADGKLLLAPVEPFSQRGESGAWVSDFMPHTAKVVDDLCFVKSLHTEQVNHAPAINFNLSGGEMPGRPTLGAWLTYGLGTATQELPSFVVMTSITKDTTCGQIFYDFYWGSGFLPSRYQGVKLRGSGDPVLYVSNPKGMSREMRRDWLDDIAAINQIKLEQTGDPEIATRIAQYEMSFRMQASVPELADLADESQETLDLYGPGVTEPGTFAHNCLMARRLAERGCGFIQLMHAGWDQHNSLTTELYNQCRDTDQPSAALVQDLKQRGMLDDTLVIWGGEFGRTPFLQGDINNRARWGRDHHPYAYTVWMAGGGVKPGISYGKTDDLGINVAENPVHVHDFQATLLHLLGIDHERFTYRFQGRQFRLTDVHGNVIRDILA